MFKLNNLFIITLLFHLCCVINSFFPSLFDFGPRTSNCIIWSAWSPCFSTAEFEFNPLRVPGECYYTSNADYIVNYNGPLLENIYSYYKHINISKNACGQCIFQISCSRTCDLTTPERDLVRAQQNGGAFTGNRFGISEQLCKGFDQSYACAVNSEEVYNRETGECQTWPPLRTDLFSTGLLITKQLRDMLYSLKPNNCISVDKKCYCCCAPFKPDPCTAKCTLQPCSDLTVFTAATLPQGRRRRFGLN